MALCVLDRVERNRLLLPSGSDPSPSGADDDCAEQVGARLDRVASMNIAGWIVGDQLDMARAGDGLYRHG